MGRKFPSIDESSLLRMRLRDALENEDVALSFVDDEDGDEPIWDEPAGPTVAGVTLDDLVRFNRNRARLIGLLHTHRAYHGAPIVVLAGNDAEGEDRFWQGDATAWIVKPVDGDKITRPARQVVH